ncbi:MAG: type II secretion system protein [Nitrospinaceae bacterium]
MTPLKNRSGFTLLELILSLVIIGFIVTLSMGGIRLGIAAREAGDQRVDTFQRLRVIGEQLSQKIKSNYPVFISPAGEEFGIVSPTQKQTKPMVLAFEGKEDSIRFITFSPPLTSVKNHPWAHEVKFYLGEHPQTGETGIIMMERDISDHDLFTEVRADAKDARHLLLARNVDHLKFRYFMLKKLTPQEVEAQGNPEFPYEGKWVNEIIAEELDTSGQLVKEQDETLKFQKENKITLPRAVEISLGLREPPPPGSGEEKEPKVIFSPPIIVLIHSGMKIAIPNKR